MSDDKKTQVKKPPRRDPYRLTGEIFSGRYRLEEFAGMGSFGAVYRATDTRVGRTVAVKILKPDLGDDETDAARELFQREALTAGRLMHPHIVAVTDVGEESDFAYLVMEWLEGYTLEDELRNRVPFTPEETAALLAPISDALQTAHNAGVIHRDIKPSNIHLGHRTRPFVKVLDFGIAKVVTSSTAVAASRIAGTVSYMSPEQIVGSRIDRRTDIYSLGIVLHQMLTGELPFKGESQGHIIQQHIATPPPLLSELRPDLPRALSNVIQRALGKLPEARQQSAQELYSEFTAALSEKGAHQPAERITSLHERQTEVMSPQLPPTVWAGQQQVEPPPLLNFAQQPTIPVPDIIRTDAPAPTPATTNTAHAVSGRPATGINISPASMIYFMLAGAIVFPLLSVLLSRAIYGPRDSIESYYYIRNAIPNIVIFGVLVGVTASVLPWANRLLYFVLGGAGVLLVLTLLAPKLMSVQWFFNEDNPRRYLLLHNMLVGATMGAVVCALRTAARLGRSIKTHLLYGAGYAAMLMLVYYFYQVTKIGIGIKYGIAYFFDQELMMWMISALLGFIIGLIVCGMRFSYKENMR